MSKGLDYEKVARQKRTTFVPSLRSQPVTQKQIDYIVGLAYQKGQPKPRLPKTRQGASDLIERLLDMPDRYERKQVRLAPVEVRSQTKDDLVKELREWFPSLTPMTVHSFLQIFCQVDEIGAYFFFNELIQSKDLPQDSNGLILYILSRFVKEFADVTDDEPKLDQ